MFKSSEMDNLIKQVIGQIAQENDLVSQAYTSTEQTTGGEAVKPRECDTACNPGESKGIPLSPQIILVVLGLLGGVLEVTSVLVDKDQLVQFVLSGTLKRPTRLDKMLNEIGSMPFDDVLRAIMNRLG